MTTASIIIPTFEADAFIARAVQSALAQTITDIEVIVVSDDQRYYAPLLGEYVSDMRLRFATTDQIGAGPGAARNVGIALARSPVVATLDADDAYHPDYLEQVLPYVLKHGACTTAAHSIDQDTGNPLSAYVHTHSDVLNIPYPFADILYANLVMDRRRCDVPWPEGVMYGEDQLYWLLIQDQLPGVYYLAEPLYDYYYRRGSLSHPTPEEGTRKLVGLRQKMVDWLNQEPSPVESSENRTYLLKRLTIYNELEEFFEYQMVDNERYQAELQRRLDREL
ncbi:MAG: glycosyltransferase family 2 protein [Rickettsiales bacterium]|nr:glycosyltransferase family 2 protein [Rickettsiales bacterium]